MFTHLHVFRAEFKHSCGTCSLLFALESIEDANDCIHDYTEKTGYEFITISDPCAMTPTLYTKSINK